MMKVVKASLIVLLGLLYTCSAFAQMIKDPTTWTFEAKKKAGNNYVVSVHLKLQEHWHIWALKPGGDGLEQPPSITFDKNPDVKTKGAVTEAGKPITGPMDGVDGDVTYFINKVDYRQSLTVSKNTKITGKYTYMVCNEKMCLPAKTKRFSIVITDAGGTIDTTATATTTAATADTAKDGVVNNNSTGADTAGKKAAAVPAHEKTSKQERRQEEKSLLWLFLAALGGGLAAVITPCVYSMIPITVSFFTKRSKTRAEGIRNAVYYSLSIIIIFTVLGVLISAIFGANALNSLSTNWIANLFFSLFSYCLVYHSSALSRSPYPLPGQARPIPRPALAALAVSSLWRLR